MLKIVLPDCQTVTNGDLDLSVLERFGSVQYYPLSSKEQVAERICDADIVLCNKSPMTAETLRHAEKLRYKMCIRDRHEHAGQFFSQSFRVPPFRLFDSAG